MKDDVLTAIRRITRAIDLHSHRLVRHHGLTGPQSLLLQRLEPRGEASIGELAGLLSLSQPTVSGIVDRLEKRGLVRRERSRFDRRRVMVQITGAGRASAAESPPLLQERFLRAFDRLEQWEQSLILSSLQRVVAMMEAERLDASPYLVTGPIDERDDDGSHEDTG